MKLTELTNAELVVGLKALVQKETDVGLKVIEHLRELDSRKLYRDLGFSSLFAYCTEELGYSEGAAQRRITAARCSRAHPEVLNMLKAKELNLTTLSLLAPVINDENKEELLAKSKSQSKANVEKVISGYKPAEVKPDRIRFISVSKTEENLPLFAKAKQNNQNHRRSESASQRVSFNFQADEEFLSKFNRTKELLSGKFPKGASCEEVFSAALQVFLEKNCPIRRAERKPGKIALRKEVFLKDGFQCTHISSEGKRCSCRHGLEVDHILPKARGGSDEISNLRLLCRAHNKLMAERHLGRNFMQRFYQ